MFLERPTLIPGFLYVTVILSVMSKTFSSEISIVFSTELYTTLVSLMFATETLLALTFSTENRVGAKNKTASRIAIIKVLSDFLKKLVIHKLPFCHYNKYLLNQKTFITTKKQRFCLCLSFLFLWHDFFLSTHVFSESNRNCD